MATPTKKDGITLDGKTITDIINLASSAKDSKAALEDGLQDVAEKLGELFINYNAVACRDRIVENKIDELKDIFEWVQSTLIILDSFIEISTTIKKVAGTSKET